MACHSWSEAFLVLTVWAIGFGIIAACAAAITWMDNRSARVKTDGAPSSGK